MLLLSLWPPHDDTAHGTDSIAIERAGELLLICDERPIKQQTFAGADAAP